MERINCAICEMEIDDDYGFVGDPGTYYEGKTLCERCYYDYEADASIVYGDEEYPRIISSTINETEGDFRVRWHSTDAWRGYYLVESERYVLANTSELLWGHHSEEMLKQFDKRIRELFDEHDIDYARAFARSSNVFFNNYDIFVKREQRLLADLLIAKAKLEVDYANPKWYTGIIFDEKSLEKLIELFPERKIQTDDDAAKLIKHLGNNCIEEIQKRIAAEVA